MKRRKKLFLILVILLLLIGIKGIKIVESKNENATSVSISPPETKEQTQLQKTTSVTASTAETLKSYFESKTHPGFLEVALAIEISCKRYDMPFETVLAIAILESNYGESDIARQKRNFFGIAAYDESPESASDFSSLSLEQAINEQICILKKDYFDKYQNNLDEISKVYCRNSDFWLEEIQWFINDLINFNNNKEVLK